jgi:ABC-type siderophore export system fused ATPase/permease subunit
MSSAPRRAKNTALFEGSQVYLACLLIRMVVVVVVVVVVVGRR